MFPPLLKCKNTFPLNISNNRTRRFSFLFTPLLPSSVEFYLDLFPSPPPDAVRHLGKTISASQPADDFFSSANSAARHSSLTPDLAIPDVFEKHFAFPNQSFRCCLFPVPAE